MSVALKERVEKAAATLEEPAAHFIREAIREKLFRLETPIIHFPQSARAIARQAVQTHKRKKRSSAKLANSHAGQ
jgi:hypothetical protein